MKKLIIILLLLSSCSNDTIIKETTQDYTLATYVTDSISDTYRVYELENKDLVLYNIEEERVTHKIDNSSGEISLLFSLLMLSWVGFCLLLGLILSN